MFSNRPGVIAASIVLPLCATVAVGLRFYARHVKGLPRGIDDWAVVPCTILAWILAAILIWGTAIRSFGTESTRNPATGDIIITAREQNTIELDYAYTLVMYCALGLTKISVILLYRRIFRGKYFDRYSLSILVLLAAWMTSFFFARLFQCGTRVTIYWAHLFERTSHCVDMYAISKAWTISDVITDVLILITPVPLIMKLRMDKSRRIGLSFVFLLRTLSTIAGLIRLDTVEKTITTDGSGAKVQDTDPIIMDTDIEIWSQVEVGIAIIAACLPTLPHLLALKAPQAVAGSVRSALSIGSHTRSRTLAHDLEDQNLNIPPSKMSTGLHNKTIQSNAHRQFPEKDVPQMPARPILKADGF